MGETTLGFLYVAAFSYAIYSQTGDEKAAIAVAVGLSIMLYLIDQKFTELMDKVENVI